MASARKGSSIQSKIQMVVYGDFFTGKSTFASQLMYFKRPDGKPFRVLYIDPETGSIDDYTDDIEANGVNLDNLYIYYTQSLTEVCDMIQKVKNNEDFYVLDDDGNETDEILLDADGEPFRADAIVVDGSTILNTTTKMGLEEFSKKRNKVKAEREGLVGDARLVKIEGSGLELRDYSKVNNRGQALILDLAACGAHYIVTAREKDETKNVELNGQIASVATGKKIPDGFKSLGYNAKTVIRMFRNEDGQVCAHIEKDRTHVHEDNAIIEDPQLLDWQSVVNKTAKNKSFTVTNDMTRSVKVENDLYSKDILSSVGIDDVAVTPTVSTSNATVSADDLKALIREKQKSLTPPQKQAVKSKLESLGLPTAFKNVTDIEVLNKVLECF